MNTSILSNFQKRIIREFSETEIKETFFLSGGTALSAFYLFHRYSDDLDFFTEIPNAVNRVFPVLDKIKKKLLVDIDIKRTFNTFSEIVITNSENEALLLHFAQDIPFRHKPTVYNEDYNIYIDNLLDISCNKFSALFDRHDMKDFVDIYFIDKEKIKFEDIFNSAKEKHIGLDNYWLSYALNHINDLTILPKMIKTVTAEELRDFYNNKIKTLMAGL